MISTFMKQQNFSTIPILSKQKCLWFKKNTFSTCFTNITNIPKTTVKMFLLTSFKMRLKVRHVYFS